jgi:hypothetical protein
VGVRTSAACGAATGRCFSSDDQFDQDEAHTPSLPLPWISPVLQRRVQFEAVAFAFAATALLTFTYGLLENVDFPRISLTWVLPLMIVLWTAGQAFRAASLRVARVRPRTPTR